MWHVRGRRELHTGFWWRNLNEREHLENLGVDVILKKSVGKVWTGFIWFRIETRGWFF
jgi:hypothetical protein